MDPDKRYNLINAAMKEFAENQFKKASTNTIVKEAGISKGLLYHYFKSKDELYEYLVHFAMSTVAGRIAGEIGLEDEDIINRIERIVQLKMEVMAQYPYLVAFSKIMYAGMDYDQIRELIMKFNPIPLDDYYQKNVDGSLFKEGVDVQMAVQNIQYTLERISDSFIQKRNMGIDLPLEGILSEISKYIAHFRQTYYKEVGQ